MPSSQLTLRQLLGEACGGFIVPPYQRRYVWGQPRAAGAMDSASFLTQCIKGIADKGGELFLNGITLSRIPGSDAMEIVDGQQRLTYIKILISYFNMRGLSVPAFKFRYANRPLAEEWMLKAEAGEIPAKADSQDTAFFNRTLDAIREAFPYPTQELADLLLDHVTLMRIELENPSYAIAAFKMMNGTKTPMAAADVIKADLMRRASENLPFAPDMPWEAASLRARYADEWEEWARWWNRADIRTYYADCQLPGEPPISLLLKLCLRAGESALDAPLGYEEFRVAMNRATAPKHKNAWDFFDLMRHAQMRFMDAYESPQRYNWLKAILMLQPASQVFTLLRHYFVEGNISDDKLFECYKLSFLGLEFKEILSGMSPTPKFDELLASLSMADVYHSEAKRDVYNLLLRLNIDEDVKLGRKFDFSIWNNRSLEHIYSKSKVWHLDKQGRPLDGNDNFLRMPIGKIKADPTYLNRDEIVDANGVQLTEHCIGNLVLLYGQNNAAFGNTSFDEKKVMFLSPDASQAFRSRNLLHSVCVFAYNSWTAQSIIDNYNLILKNLKIYYGY